MRHCLIAFMVFGVLTVLPRGVSCAPATFWVSPDGNDSAPGTRRQPFRTLERARDAVRSVNSGRTRGGDIVVYLRDGVHRLERPLVLDWRDSGPKGGEVVYRAAPGEHPVISGSTRVLNWSLSDANSGIYQAYVGPCASRQLYVNGQRAVRARTASYPSGFRPAYTDVAHTEGIKFVPTGLNPAGWRNPAKWKNPQDVEAVITTQWKMMRVPVSSVVHYPDNPPGPFDPPSGTGLLVLGEPGWTNANVFLDSSTHQPGIWSFWQVTWFENAFEFLDEPGEWYLNKHTGWLYYIPRQGEDLATADVELPLLEFLVIGRGKIDRPVANIRFEGLTFSHATWLGSSGDSGYVADQSGWRLAHEGYPPNIIGHVQDLHRTPGNIEFQFAGNITFHGNIFEHLGAVGLDFGTGSQGNTISGNLFEDISSAAIQLGGISACDHHPTLPRQVTRDNVISNNLIREVAVEYVDAAGIFVGFTRHTLISCNTIVDVPWSGIAMGWGWGLLDPGSFPGVPGAVSGEWGFYSTPTPNSENRIINNRIHGFLNFLWDGGAIYTTGRQGTSMGDALLIEGNVASGKRPLAGGNTFYTDGGSRYIKLKNNVSFDNPQGVTDFGPPPRATDPLPYSDITLILTGWPYGSDRGGCRTYGDLIFTGNYWSNSSFFDICAYSDKGVSYPTNVISKHNHDIQGEQDVPGWLLKAAGVRKRPAEIPADRWILPVLAGAGSKP
jgi:hypothetical protein